MDQTWSNWISDEIINEIYHQIFKFIYFLIKMDQICPKWIKTDQTWSNLISDETIIEIYHQIFNFIYFLIRFNQSVQNGSNLIKPDQTWSNLISDETIIEIYHQISNFIYFLVRFSTSSTYYKFLINILAYGQKGRCIKYNQIK